MDISVITFFNIVIVTVTYEIPSDSENSPHGLDVIENTCTGCRGYVMANIRLTHSVLFSLGET